MYALASVVCVLLFVMYWGKKSFLGTVYLINAANHTFSYSSDVVKEFSVLPGTVFHITVVF